MLYLKDRSREARPSLPLSATSADGVNSGVDERLAVETSEMRM